MMLAEKCSCGASFEVVTGESNYSEREREIARSELTTFRKAHKPCRDKQASAGRSSGEAMQATEGTGP